MWSFIVNAKPCGKMKWEDHHAARADADHIFRSIIQPDAVDGRPSGTAQDLNIESKLGRDARRASCRPDETKGLQTCRSRRSRL
jgi:hypothetical protein